MFYSGSSGGVKFGKTGVVDGKANNEEGTGWKALDARVTNWTITVNSQLLDTTTLGDYDKHSVYGLRTTSGTFRLFYYTDTNQADNATPKNNAASWFISAIMRAEQKNQEDGELPPNLITDESITCYLRLYIDDKTRPGKVKDYIDLNANITSASWGSNVGELVAVDLSFEATGPVLINRQ